MMKERIVKLIEVYGNFWEVVTMVAIFAAAGVLAGTFLIWPILNTDKPEAQIVQIPDMPGNYFPIRNAFFNSSLEAVLWEEAMLWREEDDTVILNAISEIKQASEVEFVIYKYNQEEPDKVMIAHKKISNSGFWSVEIEKTDNAYIFSEGKRFDYLMYVVFAFGGPFLLAFAITVAIGMIWSVLSFVFKIAKLMLLYK